MSVTELIKRLQELEAEGKGGMDVLYYDPDGGTWDFSTARTKFVSKFTGLDREWGRIYMREEVIALS